MDIVIKMLQDNKIRSGGARSSSFTNTFLSPHRNSHEKLMGDRTPPRSPVISYQKDQKKKKSRFNVTIIDAKDLDQKDIGPETFVESEMKEQK